MINPITPFYDELPQIVKILLQIFLGYFVSSIYRIVRFLETKNVVTLIVGLVALFTGIGGVVVAVIDLITLITSNAISVLAD